MVVLMTHERRRACLPLFLFRSLSSSLNSFHCLFLVLTFCNVLKIRFPLFTLCSNKLTTQQDHLDTYPLWLYYSFFKIGNTSWLSCSWSLSKDPKVQWSAGECLTTGSLIYRVGQCLWREYSRHNCFQVVDVMSLNWEEMCSIGFREPVRGSSTNLMLYAPDTLLFWSGKFFTDLFRCFHSLTPLYLFHTVTPKSKYSSLLTSTEPYLL